MSTVDELAVAAFLHWVVLLPQLLLWLAGLFTNEVGVDEVGVDKVTCGDGRSVSEVKCGSLFRSDSCEDNGKKNTEAEILQ